MGAAPRLAGYVYVTSPDGDVVALGPDSDLPDWVGAAVPNPKAWVGGVAPSGAEPKAAPRRGRTAAGTAVTD